MNYPPTYRQIGSELGMTTELARQILLGVITIPATTLNAIKKAVSTMQSRPRQGEPSVRKIALRVGISSQQVFRILNNQGQFSTETKKKVFEAIEELKSIGHNSPETATWATKSVSR